ncbi:MAG: NADH-quinone oxidoreductase subunit D [Bacteroidia bacterium]|nr:NADH-quinone oxidoreductase subunit D [Bacteroidia bacterium]
MDYTNATAEDWRVEELTLNMGPQHPATHGVLRLELHIDGEVVKRVVPHIGYMHRCFEKHAENLTYDQIIPFVDRLDYLGALNSEHAYVMAVERMLGIADKIPPRVELIRVLTAELNRIASHLLAIGAYGIDLGAITAFLWCFRDREHILNMLEWVSGARMLYNYFWIGGLYYDLPPGFTDRCREFVRYFTPKIREIETLLGENPIFVRRTANVGVLPLETAIDYGATGPVLRASGLRWDLRKVEGYGFYSQLDFDVPMGLGLMGTVGDCWDRYYVRVEEIKQSCRLIVQAADLLDKKYPGGGDFDPRALCPSKIRPEVSEFYFRAENPRGELGFFFVVQPKKDVPWRVKVRSPSFSNLSVLPELCRDVPVADVVAIVGSLDIVLCEIDR